MSGKSVAIPQVIDSSMVNSSRLFKLISFEDPSTGDPRVPAVPVLGPCFVLPLLDEPVSSTEQLLESLRHKPTFASAILESSSPVRKDKKIDVAGSGRLFKDGDQELVDEATWTKATEEFDAGLSRSRFFRVSNNIITDYLAYAQR